MRTKADIMKMASHEIKRFKKMGYDRIAIADDGRTYYHKSKYPLPRHCSGCFGIDSTGGFDAVVADYETAGKILSHSNS